jgi:hypothetical protein
MKLKILLSILVMLTLILACKSPISPPDQPANPPLLEFTDAPFATHTLTPIDISTNTPLPPQPDIEDVLSFGGAATATCTPRQPVSSCPGAPPQRMIVNQRGYICTKSDSVRLRSDPKRSAGTLIQLKPGKQFTVIGGPACSDNWSWWNIRTDDGLTGWISEGGDEIDPYFICPLP